MNNAADTNTATTFDTAAAELYTFAAQENFDLTRTFQSLLANVRSRLQAGHTLTEAATGSAWEHANELTQDPQRRSALAHGFLGMIADAFRAFDAAAQAAAA